MQLADASALVTGSSRGIGEAIAKRLVARGAHVLLHGRDGARLDGLAADLRTKAIAVDLLEPGGPLELAERCGRVDIVVHCAGVGWCGPLQTMSGEDIDRLFRVNLVAAIQLTRALLPGMLTQGRGHVAFVGSIAGLAAVGQEAVYSSTKAGLLTFADSLRLELDGTAIGVTTASPAAVQTDFWARRGVPYQRRVPRMISAERFAHELVTAIERGRARRIVPRWLAVVPAVRAGTPELYHRLAARFG